MMPFVGGYYEQGSHKKLLLLGESHYLPKKTSVCFDEKEWYDKKVDLKDEDYDYCNTRNTWEGGESPFHRHVRESLYSIFKCNDPWQHVAFFNYFLRPAREGKEFKVGKKDAELAVKNLIQVVDILSPDRIVFLSKKAVESAEGSYPSLKLGYEDFWDWAESKKIEYCYTNHPSRSWDALMPIKYWRGKWHLHPKDLSARIFLTIGWQRDCKNKIQVAVPLVFFYLALLRSAFSTARQCQNNKLFCRCARLLLNLRTKI